MATTYEPENVNVNEKAPRMSESSIEKGRGVGTAMSIVDTAAERAYGKLTTPKPPILLPPQSNIRHSSSPQTRLLPAPVLVTYVLLQFS